MLIPVGFAQVNLIFGGAGLPTGAQVTFGVEQALILASDPAAAAGAIRDAWLDADVHTVMASEIDLEDILVKYGPNDVGPSGYAGLGSTPGTGGAGGAAAVAVLMHKNTTLGGRKGRGRCYWPGVPESQVTPGGALGVGVSTSWRDLLADFFSKVDVAGMPHVLLHGDATPPTPVSSISIDPRVATQRRRQRR